MDPAPGKISKRNDSYSTHSFRERDIEPGSRDAICYHCVRHWYSYQIKQGKEIPIAFRLHVHAVGMQRK